MSLAFGQRQPCEDARSETPCIDPCPSAQRKWVLVVCILSSSLAFIEGSVVNLAAPAIQRDWSLNAGQIQWVINAYLLTTGALILLTGALGDRVGQRRMCLAGLVVFALASAWCAIADQLATLVAARVLQGAGAAAMIPASLAMLSENFPRDQRGKAIGTWAGFSAITTSLGPMLGGWIVHSFHWRGVFWVMVPLAALTFWIGASRTSNRRHAGRGRMDWSGAALLVLMFAALALAAVEQFSNVVRLSAALVAPVIALALWRVEATATSPLIPPTLFGHRTFLSANIVTLLLYGALGAALYFLPFRLINLHGYTPLQAGAAILPMTIVIGLGSVAVGGWLGRQRPGTILGAGAALVSVGLAMLAGGADQSRYLIHWLPALMAIGVGMLMCVTPLTVAAMNSLPDESSGIASGVNNMASRFAGAISIVGMTVLAEMVFSSQDALASAATDENPLASSEAVAGMAAAAFARSYNAVFWTCSALAATAALIALWTLNRRVQPNREAAPS